MLLLTSYFSKTPERRAIKWMLEGVALLACIITIGTTWVTMWLTLAELGYTTVAVVIFLMPWIVLTYIGIAHTYKQKVKEFTD